MIRHYFLIGYRNISNHLLVSFATVVGYALSISIALPVILLILERANYDSFHENGDRMFRVTTVTNGGEYRWATSPGALAEYIRNNLASVTSVHTLLPKDLKIGAEDHNTFIFRAAFVDDKFFDVFELSTMTTKELGLHQPFSIVLTENAALKLFGDTPPIGKVVSVDSIGEVTVTGILRSTDKKTHIDFEVYLSMSTAQILASRNKLFQKDFEWDSYETTYTYILVNSGISESVINATLGGLAESLLKSKLFNDPALHSLSLSAQPVKDIIRGGLYQDTFIVRQQPHALVYAVSAVILFSLASINYLNLFVTRAAMRSKEVGIRRLFGVKQKHVFLQFIVESIVLILISSVLGLTLMKLLPVAEVQNIVNSSTFNITFFLIFSIFAMALAIIAGLIPSIVVLNIGITTSLKANPRNIKVFRVGFQKILLVLQLSTSTTIFILLFVVVLQSNFMSNADYGFQTKGLLSLDLQGIDGQPFENEVSKLTGVKRTLVVSDNFGTMPETIAVRKSFDGPEGLFFKYSVGNSFLDIFDLELVAGEDFGEPHVGFDSRIIVNEAAVKALSYASAYSIIGQSFTINDTIESVVIGVVKDFHYDNFKRPILPLVILAKPKDGRYLIIEVNDEEKLDQAKAQIDMLWRKRSPHVPVRLDNYEEMFKERRSYRNDVRFVFVVALYTISISLLSLLGVTMHNTTIRSKEISIHKIFGATTRNLIMLLSKDFGSLLLISILISSTASFFVSQAILQQFVFKIDLSVPVFLYPNLITILLASSIVILRSWYTTAINPIHNLRHE